MGKGLLGGFLGIAGGIAGGIASIAGSFSDRRNAKKIKVPEREMFKPTDAQMAMVGTAEQYLNGQMPGEQEMARQIYSSTANNLEFARRGATDGSQLLAAAGQMDANAGNMFLGLAGTRATWRSQMLNNWNQAMQGLNQQQVMQWQDKLDWRNEQQARRDAYNNASRQGLIGGIAAMSGAFNNAARGVYGNKLQGMFNYGDPVVQKY